MLCAIDTLYSGYSLSRGGEGCLSGFPLTSRMCLFMLPEPVCLMDLEYKTGLFSYRMKMILSYLDTNVALFFINVRKETELGRRYNCTIPVNEKILACEMVSLHLYIYCDMRLVCKYSQIYRCHSIK